MKVKGSTFSTSSLDMDNDDVLINITTESFLSSGGNGINSSNPPYTIWDSESYTCSHALQSLKYHIHYDSSTTITDIKAHIVWANINIGTRTIKQNFEVKFIHSQDSESQSSSTDKESKNIQG